MLSTIWYELRDDFVFPADDPADDTAQQALNREILARCGDTDVIPFVFKGRGQGQRTWRIFSMQYVETDDDALWDHSREFEQNNPGRVRAVAGWYPEGNMVGTTLVVTEEPNPDYTGEPEFIPNPDYDPDPESETYDPREEIRNPAYVPPTIEVRSQTGPKRFPVPGYLNEFMPNDDGTLETAHRYLGEPDKVFD